LRIVGQNSGETAEEVREGRLDAALVGGPVDASGLDVRPIVEDSVLYVTAAPDRAKSPVGIADVAAGPLILYDARYAWRDTTRRQLEQRAREAGLTVSPLIEVEHVEGALQLAAMGLGDTLATESVTLSPHFPDNLLSVPFQEPLVDHYVFISRKDSRISPPLRELADLAEAHLRRIMARRVEAS
jgi:DNA-binding transcriptional LysR family regulator